ncbi:hypothetical protein IQ273_02270 [Nodosilinea sp. LEGE 07298]|uniref:hypothetical protein n=1 Tax=Nodosilinea sp. LEGE 07298 TaxID=2777970 RepID=UPI001881599E|nr:hypothetical protein [Nodosilinea sp. LEGE 07298]MBE9108247.1 hypothetical protein [Nodosilinea sp. LEGE 07298]
MVSNNIVARTTPEEATVLRRLMGEAILGLMLEHEEIPLLPQEAIAAYRRLGYLPQQDLDVLIQQMPFEGPERYLKRLLDEVADRQVKARNLLGRLLETDDRQEATRVFGEFFRHQFGLMEYFSDTYPRPPFEMISKLMPVWYHPCVHLLNGKKVSLINPSLRAFMKLPPKIEDYIVRYWGWQPQNRVSRFLFGRCAKHREAKFRERIRRLLFASERVHAYVFEYVEQHIINLQFRREYDEHPDEGWLNHQLRPYDE